MNIIRYRHADVFRPEDVPNIISIIASISSLAACVAWGSDRNRRRRLPVLVDRPVLALLACRTVPDCPGRLAVLVGLARPACPSLPAHLADRVGPSRPDDLVGLAERLLNEES